MKSHAFWEETNQTTKCLKYETVKNVCILSDNILLLHKSMMSFFLMKQFPTPTKNSCYTMYYTLYSLTFTFYIAITLLSLIATSNYTLTYTVEPNLFTFQLLSHAIFLYLQNNDCYILLRPSWTQFTYFHIAITLPSHLTTLRPTQLNPIYLPSTLLSHTKQWLLLILTPN